jgi:transposase
VGSGLNDKELLPDQTALAFCLLDKGDRDWIIRAESGQATASCPDCGVVSTARHSSYLRHLKDLPIQGRAVRLRVKLGRWRCQNARCKRRIFCQRLSNEVPPKHARETKRFRDTVQRVAYALGGRPGERLSQCLGLPVNKDTLLQRVKQLAQSHSHAGRIPVIGVDEWAWRKGYGGYGTILVDLKQGVVADLLPDRSAASFAKWLKEHPEVEVISRDRDGVYAEGGYDGAPRAKQVADRFHLVQSLIRAIQEELAHQRKHLLIPATELVGDNSAHHAPGALPEIVSRHQRRGPRPTPRQKEIRQQRRQQKVALFEMVKGMQAQGMRAFEIVKATGISRGRVDKWLRLSECPPQNKMAPRPGMAESFREELQQRWDQGCQNGKQLFVEMRQRGYIGSYTGLLRLLAEWRPEKVSAVRPTAPIPKVLALRHVSPQEAAALLSKPKAMLNERQSKIVEVLKRTPDFAAMRHLVLSFRSILRRGKLSSLKRWLEKAKAVGITAMSQFVRQLKKDWPAVEHAVEHTWSNGPTEGHINRLKTLKRQMYGRAGFELLRARMLP